MGGAFEWALGLGGAAGWAVFGESPLWLSCEDGMQQGRRTNIIILIIQMRKLVIRKVKLLIQDHRIRYIARIQINPCFVIQNFSLFPVYPLPLTPWTFTSREI